MQIDDTISRCIVHPKQNINGAFSIEIFMNENEIELTYNGSNEYAISVCGRTLLEHRDEVHAYGCRTAATANRNKRKLFEEKDKPFDEVKDRASYIGYYDIEMTSLLQFEHSQCEFVVACVPENGEMAHCEVRIRAKSPLTRKEFRNARIDAKRALVRYLSGPERHICECDSDIAEMLNSLEVPPLPQQFVGLPVVTN